MTAPLCITFVAPFGLGQKTTVWARTLPLARYLARQGHQVTLLIPPWDTPQDAGKRWIDAGVEVINVALGGGIPVIVARLLRLIDARQPDIVHIIKPRAHAGLVQWWLWQRRRLETAATLVDRRPIQSLVSNLRSRSSHPKIFLDIDDWEQAWATINRYPRPVARFLLWQEEWGIRHADAITAASRWLVARVQQYTPHTPVLYLPNGVEATDNAVVELPTSRALPQILFFTRFVEVEPAWLAAFWSALHEFAPDARLLIAGEALQPGREAIYQQELRGTHPSAAGQVEWLGYVQPATLAQLYGQVGCAIFPASRTPLLEAKCSVKLATTLLYGVPVVASAVGEQAAYGADGAACLVPPEATPAAFAHAVAALLQQPGQQQAMIAQAHYHLRTHYLWPALGKKLEEFYLANRIPL